MLDEPVVICISGMAGSGKSTVARRLAEKYGLKYCSGGDSLKAFAIDKGYKNTEHGWWESGEGMRFMERRGEDLAIDKAVDKEILEIAKQGNMVLDSWAMPWLLKDGFKVWLDASLEKRAERVAQRDRTSLEDALDALKRKEEKTKAIYRDLYGFNLGEDFGPFHLVLDTESLSKNEVFQILCMVVDKVVLKRKRACQSSG